MGPVASPSSAASTARTITRIFGRLLDRSEAMTRDALRKLPEGTFRYVDFLDNDGVELDQQGAHRGGRDG